VVVPSVAVVEDEEAVVVAAVSTTVDKAEDTTATDAADQATVDAEDSPLTTVVHRTEPTLARATIAPTLSNRVVTPTTTATTTTTALDSLEQILTRDTIPGPDMLATAETVVAVVAMVATEAVTRMVETRTEADMAVITSNRAMVVDRVDMITKAAMTVSMATTEAMADTRTVEEVTSLREATEATTTKTTTTEDTTEVDAVVTVEADVADITTEEAIMPTLQPPGTLLHLHRRHQPCLLSPLSTTIHQHKLTVLPLEGTLLRCHQVSCP